MGDQKNLFLAIGLSIAIIVIFQMLFPQQAVNNQTNNNQLEEKIEPFTSIDGNQSPSVDIIKTKEEIISQSNRVNIKTPSLLGSINLNGAILDDLTLQKYNKKLNDNSEKITLFAPTGTSNPYYFELGWKQLSNSNLKLELPNLETKWEASNKELTPNNPVTLTWVNNQNI